MEMLIIGLVTGLSIFYLVKRARSALSSKNATPCECGCSGCNTPSSDKVSCEQGS